MSRVPNEAPSWADPPDPDATARQLREQLESAKARMREHRETMRAAGLTTQSDDDAPAP
jgi:hypothetical protein